MSDINTGFEPVIKVGTNLTSVSTTGSIDSVLHKYTVKAGTLIAQGDSMSVIFNGDYSNLETQTIDLSVYISDVEVCFSQIATSPSGFFKVEVEFSRSTPEELKCQSTITIDNTVSTKVENIVFNPIQDFNVELKGSHSAEGSLLTCQMSSLYLTKKSNVEAPTVIYLTATLTTDIAQFPPDDLFYIFQQDYSLMNGDDFYAALPALDGTYPIFGQFTTSTFSVLETIEVEYGINWLPVVPKPE